jgi:catechol 2,3-dioxygenase-like lactoylglutathione lyase family enzyme
MQATLRYLAIVSEQPEQLAEFYVRHMGLRELTRSPSGEITLTDDLYNLSILPRRDGDEPGLSRPGIAIDNLDELKDRLRRYAPDVALEPEPGGPHYGDYRVRDPNGYAVSISTSSFGLPPAAPRRPAIRHVALCEPNGDAVAKFYVNVLGLERRNPQRWSWGFRALGDGLTAFTVLANADEMRAHGREVDVDHFKPGLNHFGIEAASPIEERLVGLPPGARVAKRPDRDEYYRVWDVDGNHFDLRGGDGWQREAEGPRIVNAVWDEQAAAAHLGRVGRGEPAG